MKKLCLATLLISITYAQVTFNVKNQCSCSDLTIKSDCNYAFPNCIWDTESNSCSTKSCSSIPGQSSCSSNLNCMWNGQACFDFTACNQLTGVNQKECLEKSLNCPSSNGVNCASFNSLKSCSSYSNSSSCDLTLGSRGLCYWTNGSCKELTSCSQLDLQDCGNNGDKCKYNYITQNCTEQSCASFKSAGACKQILNSFAKPEYQLCQWNSTDKTCNSANDTSNLDKYSCYDQTLQTYRWVNSTNECVPCAGNIIYVVIMAIFMIMI